MHGKQAHAYAARTAAATASFNMSLDLDQAKALEKEAEQNNGYCTHCQQTIKIYRYGISTSMVRVLRVMAKGTTTGTTRAIDVDDLSLRHSERTQLTKMRFHGLVAKVKEDGHQIPRHWLITHKGWRFLANEPVPAKVVVYNNQVLGHDGGTVTIKRVAGEPGDYEAEPVTEAESRTYAHMRKPEYGKKIRATYISRAYSAYLKTGETYDMEISKLQVGQPIKIRVPSLPPAVCEISYTDIATFKRYWRVENEQ